MTKDMFPSFTKAVVNKLGSGSDLISNHDLNRNWELLTLVRIRRNCFFTSLDLLGKYEPLALKLSSIIGEEELCLEPKAELLVEDFQNFSLADGGVAVGGGSHDVEGEVTAHRDSVDASSTVTLMSERLSSDSLEALTLKSFKVDQKVVDKLKLRKGEKLGFVKQRVYNTGPVQVWSKTSVSGSVGAKVLRFVSAGVKGEKHELTKFTVPQHKVFAFALKEILIWGDTLEFSTANSVRRSGVPTPDSQIVPTLIKGLQRKENLLKPLEGRGDVLEKLEGILEDRDALVLLEDTLDRSSGGEFQRPQSEAVALFVDFLDVSPASANLTRAVHLLTSALAALPGDTPALLAKCGLESLNCIGNMVDGLKDGHARLPESAPLPLQEEGELHWAARFIASANNLEDLKGSWDYPDVPPLVMLEVFYMSVRGLSMMQS